MNDNMIEQWHPVGFLRDQFATRGWGTLVEAVTNEAIPFVDLVGRYNYLLMIFKEQSILQSLKPPETSPLRHATAKNDSNYG